MVHQTPHDKSKPTSLFIKTVKVIWIGISVTVLIITLVSYDGRPNSWNEVFLVLSMTMLSLPSGFILVWLWTKILWIVYTKFSITVSTSYLSFCLEWLVFFTIGYFQWFKLVPYLLRKAVTPKTETKPTVL